MVVTFAACSPEEKKGGSRETSKISPGNSVVCKLFLANDSPSQKAYIAVRDLQKKYGHSFHLLCLKVQSNSLDGFTQREMERYGVRQVPCAVFDGYWLMRDFSHDALKRAFRSCMDKPNPRLSMEINLGVIAQRNLAITFQACNHSSNLDFDGIVEIYVANRGVTKGGWERDSLCRGLVKTQTDYHIARGLCRPPLVVTWGIPPAIDPASLGALVVIYDRSYRIIDSICSDPDCTRSRKCPG